jgi:hypothetical protein
MDSKRQLSFLKYSQSTWYEGTSLSLAVSERKGGDEGPIKAFEVCDTDPVPSFRARRREDAWECFAQCSGPLFYEEGTAQPQMRMRKFSVAL